MQGCFAAAGTVSRFYRPHHHHDGSDPLATSEASTTHSGRLGACLAGLLDGPASEARFSATERRVLDLRLEVYDQF